MADFFTPLPLTLTLARQAHDIEPAHWLVAVYLAEACFLARNTGDGVAIVRCADIARDLSQSSLVNLSAETVRRKLRDLEAFGWVECETRRGPDAPWLVRLTGLHHPPRPSAGFGAISTGEAPAQWKYGPISTGDPPPEWKLISTGTSAAEPSPDDATSDGKRDPAPTEPPPEFPLEASQSQDRRDETRLDERTPGLDQRKVVGEGSGDAPKIGGEPTTIEGELGEVMRQAGLAFAGLQERRGDTGDEGGE